MSSEPVAAKSGLALWPRDDVAARVWRKVVIGKRVRRHAGRSAVKTDTLEMCPRAQLASLCPSPARPATANLVGASAALGRTDAAPARRRRARLSCRRRMLAAS